MKVTNKKHLALAYLTQSIYYLQLSESVFSETKKQGNRHIIVSSTPIIDYEERTKWSDFNIIFPTLFVFYHGLELMLKGLLILSGQKPKPNHHLLVLLNNLTNKSEIDLAFINTIKKYIIEKELEKTPLGDWLKKNKLNVDGLYEWLRYPTDKNQLDIVENYPLQYKQDKILPFLEGIVSDSKILRTLAVSFYRKMVPESLD